MAGEQQLSNHKALARKARDARKRKGRWYKMNR